MPSSATVRYTGNTGVWAIGSGASDSTIIDSFTIVADGGEWHVVADNGQADITFLFFISADKRLHLYENGMNRSYILFNTAFGRCILRDPSQSGKRLKASSHAYPDSCPSEVAEQRRRNKLRLQLSFQFRAELLSGTLKALKGNYGPWLRCRSFQENGLPG